MKDKEKKTARILYVEQGRTAKDIASLVNVTEKTVSAWVQKFGWRSARNANITSRDNRIENIRKIIDGFASDRLELQTQIKELVKDKGDKEQIAELRKETAKIDSGVANWNKTLENVDKNSRVTLSTYLYVTDNIFKALQMFDTKLYMQSIPFMEQHVNEIAIKLG